MTDIVERLRDRAVSNTNCLCGNPVCNEAADEIERLREDNRKLAAEVARAGKRAEKIERLLKESQHCLRQWCNGFMPIVETGRCTNGIDAILVTTGELPRETGDKSQQPASNTDQPGEPK